MSLVRVNPDQHAERKYAEKLLSQAIFPSAREVMFSSAGLLKNYWTNSHDTSWRGGWVGHDPQKESITFWSRSGHFFHFVIVRLREVMFSRSARLPKICFQAFCFLWTGQEWERHAAKGRDKVKPVDAESLRIGAVLKAVMIDILTVAYWVKSRKLGHSDGGAPSPISPLILWSRFLQERKNIDCNTLMSNMK